jgi:hypothetical protein
MQVDVAATDHNPCPPTARSILVFAILAELRARDIPVAVLNGVHGPSAHVGRDVDVLIRRKDLSVVADLSRAIAATQGWNYATARWLGSWYPRGLYQQVFHRVDGGRILNVAFDLICSDGIAAGLITVYSPQLLHGGITVSEGVPTSVAGAYMKSAFIKALAGIEEGLVKVDQARRLPQEVRQHIASILGDRFLHAYERCILQGRIRSTWRSLRHQAQCAYARRHPLAACRNGAISLTRRIFGSRVHHVRSIAIVGHDGVGKSAIERARQMLGEAFLDVRYRHSRPEVLSNLAPVSAPASSTPANDPARQPQRHRGRCANLRRWYFGLDDIAGYWLRDRRSTSSEIPVNVYKRCALDMAGDPLRFGLPLRNQRLWLYHFIRKVDRTIVLYDQPGNIEFPTSELSNNDIRRQSDYWNALYGEGLVTQIINVNNKTAEAVGAEIARSILDLASPDAELPSV